ncbi:MAG: 50S ribosomal protein L32 [bacterium]|nr:50S ribosomal protein L32 [bacterium]
MAHPKHRKSKSKTRMGRAHHHLRPASLVECNNCRGVKMPHRVCPHCGHYKGSAIV